VPVAKRVCLGALHVLCTQLRDAVDTAVQHRIDPLAVEVFHHAIDAADCQAIYERTADGNSIDAP
jgi:hypothetical protein